MLITKTVPKITWEELPDYYLLPDEPVDNIAQPALAATLKEILELAGIITPEMLISTNFGICATVDGRIVVKAPDWVFIPKTIPVQNNQNRRSYTPILQGEKPAIVIECISETEGGEYSINPRYPYGKMYFYERILQVPIYVIFDTNSGQIEVRDLISGNYRLRSPENNHLYWIEPLELYLGVWTGTKADITGFWLRWWDKNSNLLPWGTEKIAQTETQLQLLQQEAEKQRKKAELLTEKLRSLGIDPDSIDGENDQ
jgi:Uma2 family endonuclease